MPFRSAKTYKSRLYHIYNDPEVKDDLNRKAEPEEPLPDLVINGYYLSRLRLAGDGQAWAQVRLHNAACDDYRREPHRDGGAHQVRL